METDRAGLVVVRDVDGPGFAPERPACHRTRAVGKREVGEREGDGVIALVCGVVHGSDSQRCRPRTRRKRPCASGDGTSRT